MREQIVRRSLAAAFIAVGLCAATAAVPAQAAPTPCHASSGTAMYASNTSSAPAPAACGGAGHVTPLDWTW